MGIRQVPFCHQSRGWESTVTALQPGVGSRAVPCPASSLVSSADFLLPLRGLPLPIRDVPVTPATECAADTTRPRCFWIPLPCLCAHPPAALGSHCAQVQQVQSPEGSGLSFQPDPAPPKDFASAWWVMVQGSDSPDEGRTLSSIYSLLCLFADSVWAKVCMQQSLLVTQITVCVYFPDCSRTHTHTGDTLPLFSPLIRWTSVLCSVSVHVFHIFVPFVGNFTV